MRILLINPNTNAATTANMLAIARAAAPEGVAIDGVTAPFGADLIDSEQRLAVARDAVRRILERGAAGYDGAIIAAFGDPGREFAPPDVEVIGIAEAGMRAGAEDGRRFSIVTTTPGLGSAIKRLAQSYGVADQLVSLRFTQGVPPNRMADQAALSAALERAAVEARDDDRAEAVVIGGGPLARAAAQLARRLALPIIEPVPAAVRQLSARIAAGRA